MSNKSLSKLLKESKARQTKLERKSRKEWRKCYNTRACEATFILADCKSKLNRIGFTIDVDEYEMITLKPLPYDPMRMEWPL